MGEIERDRCGHALNHGGSGKAIGSEEDGDAVDDPRSTDQRMFSVSPHVSHLKYGPYRPLL
jgi:hypothetical protein